MRRRGNAAASSEDMSEPLLHSDDAPDPLQSSRTAIIPYAPFSVEAFVAYILQRCQVLLHAVFDYCNRLLGRDSAVRLSLTQEERLWQLRDALAVPFDIGSPEHQDALRGLWTLAFPDLPCSSLKSRQWTEMGWQGDNPATDFRGAGYFGLVNLMYLGSQHPTTFHRLCKKLDGRRSEWEYPFAVAGLNITHALSELLELRSTHFVPKGAAGTAFLALLDSSEDAFNELYCLTFEVLDRVWLDKQATYMEFPTIMQQTKRVVESALLTRPKSLEDLRFQLRSAAQS